MSSTPSLQLGLEKFGGALDYDAKVNRPSRNDVQRSRDLVCHTRRKVADGSQLLRFTQTTFKR